MVNFTLAITLISLVLIVHVYVGYPAILWLLNKIKRKQEIIYNEDFIPNVTMMISCYNEINVIDEKVRNALALDYPKDKLQIVVISDGSDDGTDDVVSSYEGQGVRLVRQEGRLGKTSAINLAMKSVDSEIVVFSDANAMYQPDAIKKLVRNFGEDNIGYVVGAALYTDGNQNAAAASEDLYWQYEIALKTMESNLHSVVGGDGAIYAIRRELYKELDVKDINDFVNPLQIIEQGYRGVFDKEAICLEETAGDFNKEAKRKQRIVNRSFRGLMKVKAVMNPLKFGFYSFEIISHKLLRWLQPIFIVAFGVGSISLAYQDSFLFQWISLLGLIFIFLAQIGLLRANKEQTHAIFTIPYYFLMVNYYSFFGILAALAGNIQVTWSSPRHELEKKHYSLKGISIFLIANLCWFKVVYDVTVLLID